MFYQQETESMGSLSSSTAGTIRSSVNRHTWYTPNKLMLGREINTPVDLVFSSPKSDIGGVETDKYVGDLIQNMQKAHEIARRTLRNSEEEV